MEIILTERSLARTQAELQLATYYSRVDSEFQIGE